MAPSDKRRANFVKLARFILNGMNRTDARDHAEAGLIGQVELEVPSGFSLRNSEPGDDVTFPDPMIAADGMGRNVIRFVRVGGQMELFINGRRILYQPILADLKLQSIRFQAVGTSIYVSEFTVQRTNPAKLDPSLPTTRDRTLSPGRITFHELAAGRSSDATFGAWYQGIRATRSGPARVNRVLPTA